MMRVAATIAALGVADAAIVSAQGQKFRGTGAARMQPEVVAHSLVKMEEEWKAQALAFNECTATSTADDEMSACVRAPKAFQSSCTTVVNAVVQSSSGDKSSVSEYMSDICGQQQLEGWLKTRCQGLASAVAGHMTANSAENRDDFDGQAVCHKFWTAVVEEEKANSAAEAAALEKENAAEAATRAEDAKKAAEEDAKAAEQSKKDEELRQAADAQRAKEVAEQKLVDKAQTDQDAKVAAEEDAKAVVQQKKDQENRKAADAKQDKEKGAEVLAEKVSTDQDAKVAAEEDAKAAEQKKKDEEARKAADAKQDKEKAKQSFFVQISKDKA